MRFLCDCHLGKLAKYLRILGFDTLYFPSISDDGIIKIAKDENRIVLTRDRELHRRLGELSYYVEPIKFKEQFDAIYNDLHLEDASTPFVRCLLCNEEVVEVEKEKILDRLEPKTKEFYDEFFICSKCGKIYWEGDHYKNMNKSIKELTGSSIEEKFR